MEEIDKAAKVIARYLLAKVRVRHRPVKKGLHPADVIPSLHRGVRVFHHEITVYPKAPGIITSDPQDDDLFRAIILGEMGPSKWTPPIYSNGGSTLWSWRAPRPGGRWTIDVNNPGASAHPSSPGSPR